MIGFLGRRLLQAVPVLIISSMLVFLLLYLSPGDPALNILGADASPQQVAALRDKLGLDKPLPVQYAIWADNLLHGDMGVSYVSGRTVSSLVGASFVATFQLALAAVIVTIVISMTFGTLAALRANRPIDSLINGAASIAIASPYFWLGILSILLFAVVLHWLPPGGYVPFGADPTRALQYLLLPAIVMSIRQAAILARFVRNAVVEVLEENFVRMAYAKGLSTWRVVGHHAIRNALIPIVTMLGVLLGRMLGGAVVIESIFSWPGLGRLLVTSVTNRDYPVAQGDLLVMVVIFLCVNILTDLLYGVIDPRIRVGGGRK